MREQESDGNRFYELKDMGLIITPQKKCIINSFKGNYNQFVWQGDQTEGYHIENLKYILLKKADELEGFLTDFDLDY